MYQTGDIIVYGENGLCEIKEVCGSPFSKEDSRIYYILEPCAASGHSRIYVPVEGDARVTRYPLSRQEAETFLASIDGLEPLDIASERVRRQIYREALSTADPAALVRILRTVSCRRTTMAERGKRPSDADLEYERLARNFLFRELSLAFEIGEEEVETELQRRGVALA